MLIHDDPNYHRTGWEERLSQLINNGKDPGPLYAIIKNSAIDHNQTTATVYEVYCERGIIYEINGDSWFVADAESAKQFIGNIGAFEVWSSAEIAQISQCPVSAIETTWPPLYKELIAVGQGSVQSQAAAIGTCAIETASTFMPVREAYWLNEDWRKNNLRYYPYYGRGLIQLTWDYNYVTIGNKIGIDLLNNPDLALDPMIAAKSFALFWVGKDIQEPANREDWREVRRRVQGGSDGLDRLISISNNLLEIARNKGVI